MLQRLLRTKGGNVGATRGGRNALALGAALCAVMLAGQARAADGKTIVMQGNGKGAPPCMACHGIQGQGNAAGGFPMLAGHSAHYLAKQLQDFQQGLRSNATMGPIAKALTDDQIQAVAKYYASQKPPAKAPGSKNASKAELQLGQELVTQGQWGQGIPACVRCHGPDARGNPPHFPPLAGQGAGYIEAQLKAFKDNSRRNDAGRMMRHVAEALSAKDVTAVASYLATVSPASDR